jgi:hypothetical protein
LPERWNYQTEEGLLLWIGERRTIKTLLRFFRWFGNALED